MALAVWHIAHVCKIYSIDSKRGAGAGHRSGCIKANVSKRNTLDGLIKHERTTKANANAGPGAKDTRMGARTRKNKIDTPAPGQRLRRMQRYTKQECDMRNLKAMRVMRRRRANAKMQACNMQMQTANATCECRLPTRHANARCKCDVQMRNASAPRTQSASATKRKLDNAQVRQKASASKCVHDKA